MVLVSLVVPILIWIGLDQWAIRQPIFIPDPVIKSIPRPAAISTKDLWRYTNEERQRVGLPNLVLSVELSQSAEAKCQDMVTDNYWSHDSPSGKTPWYFVPRPYAYAGENLAYGYTSAESTVLGWMNSPTHKENVLGDFTNEGFAVCESFNFVDRGHQLIVVQHLTK